MAQKSIELTEVHDFEKVIGSVCLVIVFQRDSTINLIKTEDDLKQILERMLKRKEDGKYPFIAINLGPVAYGRVKKSAVSEGDASLSSPSSS